MLLHRDGGDDEGGRVLRPGGAFVYTVRHTDDAHYGTGTAHGDHIHEHGGFAVHFFDRTLVEWWWLPSVRDTTLVGGGSLHLCVVAVRVGSGPAARRGSWSVSGRAAATTVFFLWWRGTTSWGNVSCWFIHFSAGGISRSQVGKL